jgi:hypothetical protein
LRDSIALNGGGEVEMGAGAGELFVVAVVVMGEFFGSKSEATE